MNTRQQQQQQQQYHAISKVVTKPTTGTGAVTTKPTTTTTIETEHGEEELDVVDQETERLLPKHTTTDGTDNHHTHHHRRLSNHGTFSSNQRAVKHHHQTHEMTAASPSDEDETETAGQSAMHENGTARPTSPSSSPRGGGGGGGTYELELGREDDHDDYSGADIDGRGRRLSSPKSQAQSPTGRTLPPESTPSRQRRQQQQNDAFLGSWMREWRHSPCLMRPLSLTMFFIFGLFMVVTLVFQLPGLVLGLILAPAIQRSTWYIEFLYPLPIGRWAHLLLMRVTASRKHKKDDKNRGFHSRTVEQTIEVVPNRVYIHPIPQWLDNVGYLIVCIPEPSAQRTGCNTVIRVDEVGKDPIIGILIDCGECPAVVRAIDLVSEYHYQNRHIQIQSIASTHKHHDHTGGNAELLQHPTIGQSITRVYGGAVERVPCCTDPLVDGQKLILPTFQSNDMNELVEIEAVGVPAHTRGSLVYRLRSKQPNEEMGGSNYAPAVEYMFTGDTIFSGGSGVPFESDIGIESEKKLAKSNGNTFVHGNLGASAIERCFSEVVARAMPRDDAPDACDRIIIFPGHEYTQDLLLRQFQHGSAEQGRWKNLPPRDFFETVSHMYTSFHRRSLPQNSGKLMTIPSTLQREVHINTVFRSLKRSAELVVRAVVFWYDHFCKEKIGNVQYKNPNGRTNDYIQEPATGTRKTPSTVKRWNIDDDDISRSVFTTIYTADLQQFIDDLRSGNLDNEAAADQLRSLTQRMNVPTVNKRPIPGFMPSDKNIYRGICGLTLLGSKPCAMTISDSRAMNLPPPVSYNSDKILVSQKRLTLVLRRLGMIRSPSGDDVSLMIHQLWKEANQIFCQQEDNAQHFSDPESIEPQSKLWHDEVDLGVLKWLMYGVPANQPSWMSQTLCMPCSNVSDDYRYVFPEHPACQLNKKNGELVSHDVLTCLLCRDVTGNIQLTDRGDGDDGVTPIAYRPSHGTQDGQVVHVSQTFRSRSTLKEEETSDSWNDLGVQEWEGLVDPKI